jgi:hypothetical protein
MFGRLDCMPRRSRGTIGETNFFGGDSVGAHRWCRGHGMHDTANDRLSGRSVTERPFCLAEWEQTHGKKKAKCVLTSTGLLMEGVEVDGQAVIASLYVSARDGPPQEDSCASTRKKM